MARTNLYVLYDIEAQTLAGPILQFTRHAAAARAFIDLLRTKDTLPNSYPEHFKLLHLGTVDTETGIISPENQPITVIAGKEHVSETEGA